MKMFSFQFYRDKSIKVLSKYNGLGSTKELLPKVFSYLLDGELAGELRVSDWLERKASHLDRESLSLGALASC